jgi:YegS/Rv2252/BmrU family lipid kinase
MQPGIVKKIAIVCNPLAGSGRAVKVAEQIAAMLAAKNIEHSIFSANWPAAFTGYTEIFIAGGDGTLNYFINQYPNIQLPLVIFRAGTGNDFHWLLYGSKSLDEQLDLVLQATPRSLDVGKCNERFFINGLGIGFSGDVVKSMAGKKKLKGKTSFFIGIVKKIFTYQSKLYTVQSVEKKVTARKLLIDISNGRRAGGGYHIAPEARADDGWFDVVMVDAMNPLKRMRYLPVMEKGKHLGLYFIDHFLTQKISIESESNIQYHLDGEYFEAPHLNIEIIPAAINFLF